MGYEPDGRAKRWFTRARKSTVKIKILIRGAGARRRSKSNSTRASKFYSNKGFAENYKKADRAFRKGAPDSIRITARPRSIWDARINALFEKRQVEAAYRKAIEIDPDYLEARASLAGDAARYRQLSTNRSVS